MSEIDILYAVLLPKVIRLQHHHKPKQIEREFIVPFPASHSPPVNRIEIAPEIWARSISGTKPVATRVKNHETNL